MLLRVQSSVDIAYSLDSFVFMMRRTERVIVGATLVYLRCFLPHMYTLRVGKSGTVPRCPARYGKLVLLQMC